MTIAAEIRKFVDEFLLGYFRLFNYIHFKMKTLTFLFFGLLLCPMTLLAQSADVLLQKVADALSAGKDDYAVSLFRQAADADAGQTEMFYWTSVGKPLRQLRGLRRNWLFATETNGITTRHTFL